MRWLVTRVVYILPFKILHLSDILWNAHVLIKCEMMFLEGLIVLEVSEWDCQNGGDRNEFDGEDYADFGI